MAPPPYPGDRFRLWGKADARDRNGKPFHRGKDRGGPWERPFPARKWASPGILPEDGTAKAEEKRTRFILCREKRLLKTSC